jgi:tRNA (mo5U34)-methyltransferase
LSQARNAAVTEETKKQIAELQALGWYHSIELPGGEVLQGFHSIDRLKNRLAQFAIPADLTGKRVLDIGAWNGWFTFEMEHRGARVVALDLVAIDNFLLARDLLKSKVEYRVGDICSFPSTERFDIVLFFGVLYHLKHPLLALERVCQITTDTAYVESFVTDDGTDLNAPPVMEYYEGTELRGQFDNWSGPNVACLLAMARMAGFAEVQLESVIENRAHVTCRRKWSTTPGDGPAPAIICVENSVSQDHDFSASRDDHLAIHFKSEATGISCDNVYAEVGPYATRPAQVVHAGGDGWLAICKLPPGLDPLWHQVRLRVSQSKWSNSVRIPVDLPPGYPRSESSALVSPELRVSLVTDGITWDRWRVKVGAGSCLSLWARGIPDGCATEQISVLLNEVHLPAVFVSETDPEGLKQVNALLPAGLRPGSVKLRLECAGHTSAPMDIDLTK